MISSGIKRKMAITAVSAMAVAGFAAYAGPAMAVPGQDQAGGANTVILAAPGHYISDNDISTHQDGVNETYRLEAVGGANVTQVRFAYERTSGAVTDPNPVTIATTTNRNDDGFFSLEWNGAAPDGTAIPDGTDVTIFATGLDSNGATLTADSFATVIDNSEDAINLADGTTLGVFQQPYAGEAQQGDFVRLHGTSSTPGGTSVFCNVWDPTTHDFTGGVAACNGATQNAAGSGSTFDVALDISGSYPIPLTANSQILLGVDTLAGNGDAEGYGLYTQAITTVTAAPATSSAPFAGTSPIVVTVLDQNGQPIAGAQVFDSNKPTTMANAVYTDSQGRASFNQSPGSTTYFANADDVNAYDPTQGDKISGTVTVNPIAPVATSLKFASNDGPAFDYDENGAGDLTVQVQDQAGNAYDTTGQNLYYHYVITKFSDGSTVTTPDQSSTVETNGKFNVDLPTTTFDGTYQLVASLGATAAGAQTIASSTIGTFKAGDSKIAYNNPNPDQALVGSSDTVSGALVLGDGTGLSGRSVLVQDNNGGGNGAIVRTNGLLGSQTTLTTDANGAFSVTVKDPATPATAENDNITATTQPGTSDMDNPLAGPTSTVVQFRTALVTPVISFSGITTGKPGTAHGVTVHVADGVGGPAVANDTVNLSIDHGFFTNGHDAAAPAVGAETGVLKNLGTTITVRTDAGGDANVSVDIERDAGFDDDGTVNATVTGTVAGPGGNVTQTATQPFSTNSATVGAPINGASVLISRAAANLQSVTILPKAPTNESVKYDVTAKDQFGNLVAVPVTVTDNLVGGKINGDETSSTVNTEYTGGSPQVVLTSVVAGDQTPTATWNAPFSKYVNPLPNVQTGTTPLTGTGETINWYVINFAASHYSLTHDTASTVAVGASVVETYKAIDQNGEPIAGVTVGFLRSGPDVYQDGSFAHEQNTNQAGTAQYVYTGAAPGTAIVQAIIDDSNSVDGAPNTVVSESRAQDQVSFAGSNPAVPVAPVAISAALKGHSQGHKDKVKVVAPASAAGAHVTLYKKKNGKLVAIGSKTLNSAGHAKFKVSDKNGNAITKYVVNVAATATTLADTSKIRLT